MLIEPAGPEDAQDVARVTHAAFAPVAADYGVDWLPPLSDTPESVREAMRDGAVVLKAVDDAGSVVGSVRGTPRDGIVEVGRLVVDPGAQRQGAGEALMRALEGRFPDAERFELFTGDMPGPSLRLYERLGYRVFRESRDPAGVRLLYLEKPGPASEGSQ